MKTLTLARTFKTSILSAAIALVSLNASAALYDRGNGMIFDSTQNITWLQDANYAHTSGFRYGGRFSSDMASYWVNNLVYGGFTDWRLPSARLIDNTLNISYDGSTDYGYNNTRSELGHLFVELGNLAIYTSAGYQLDYGLFGWKNSSFTDAATGNSVSFLNVQSGYYWEAESYLSGSNSDNWLFGTINGAHTPYYWGHSYANDFAWAVRDGDVLAVNEVPVPAAAWLMGSGLLSLAGLARRKK